MLTYPTNEDGAIDITPDLTLEAETVYAYHAEAERDIARYIRDMGWRHRTTKQQEANRVTAVFRMRTVYAMCIADDVLRGDKPWEAFVVKYEYVTKLNESKL